MTSQNDESDLLSSEEVRDRNAQLQTIPEYLTRLNVSEDALLHFHDWLLPTAVTWRLTDAALEILPRRTHREEIDRLTELMKSAEKIAAQFDFFEQLLPLDQLLSDAYQALPPLVRREGSRKWKQYRERVHADMKVLVQLSEAGRANLRAKGSKLGAPRKIERDALFLDLLGRLEHLTGTRSDRTLEATVETWNDYFAAKPEKGMNQAETAKTAKNRGELTFDAAFRIRKRGRRCSDTGRKYL